METTKMKNLKCKRCDTKVKVEKDIVKVTCSHCCATMGMGGNSNV